MDYFYDGWMHIFGASNSKVPFNPIIKLGRARVFFNRTLDCVWLEEESRIRLEGE